MITTTPPAGDHVLRLQADGDVIVARIECHEPIGASCRIGCARPDCERESPLPHVDEEGSEFAGHGEADYGRCLITTEWLVPDIDEFHDMSVAETIADGMPVVLNWDSDSYIWRGAESVVTASTGGRR